MTLRFTQTVRASSRVPLLQAAKVALATVAAWVISSALLPDQLPVFGAVAALLVVQPSVNQSMGKAIERSIGVIVGVLVAYGVSLIFGSSSWIVLLAIVLAIFVAWALRLSTGTSNQVPISAMLVLSIGASNSNYAFDRIIETIIGAIIGIIVNLAIVPPVLLQPAKQGISALGEEIAATLDRLADSLITPQNPATLAELLLTARLLRPMQEKATKLVLQAEESLTFNPRGTKHRKIVHSQAELLAKMAPLVTRSLGMTRAVHDRYDEQLHTEPTVHAIADELTRAAHDLLLIIREPEANGSSHDFQTAELPVLTAPLYVAAPHPEHWVLVGSLLEDLRRVHEEITGTAAQII